MATPLPKPGYTSKQLASLEFANNGPYQQGENAQTARLPTINAQRVASGLAPYNPQSSADRGEEFGAYTNYLAGQMTAAKNNQVAKAPVTPRAGTTGTSSGGSSGRRSGGGGGAAALPKLTQQQLDWAASVLGGGAPQSQTAGTLDLPDYAGMAVRAFDPSQWQQALAALAQGQQTDLGTASTATQNMLNFLNTNYTNAFNNPNQTYATAGQAPGMTQLGMQRLLQGQGADPNLGAGAYQQAQTADEGFGNLWRTLAGSEDIAQRGRINNANLYGSQAADAINAAAAGGRLGLGLGQSQAQGAWQQRADERAYQDYQMQQQIAQQEAMNNWQRANTVQDANTAASNSYRNAEMQSLLGLLPQLISSPGLNLPSLQALGLAA